MKFQKLFGVFLIAAMLVISGLSQVKAQDQAQTPVQTPVAGQDQAQDQMQAQPKHHHKKATAALDANDIAGRIEALEQQNQALQDRIQALENSGLSTVPPVTKGEYGNVGGTGIHEEFVPLDDATEYFADEEPRKLVFANKSGSFEFIVAGFMQAEYNYFFGPAGQYLMDDASKETTQKEFNGFLPRRAHLDFGVKFDEMYSFSIGLESDKSTAVSIGFYHAYMSIKFDKALVFTAGKFSNILSLENLQPSADLPLMENSMVSGDLAVNKDIGIMLSGEVNHMVDYGIELANGQEDDESSAVGPGKPATDNKTATARIFTTPFKKDDDELLKGLGIGIGGSWGNEVGAASPSGTAPAENLIWTGQSSGFQTSFGGNAFFVYGSGVTAAGDNYHWDPQFYYYNGPFGLQGELIHSIVTVANGTPNTTQLDNSGWMLEGNWVFGGKARFEGAQVDEPFDLEKGKFGAFEVVTRFSQIQIDIKSFTTTFPYSLGSPLGSGAQDATAWGAGFNWWFNEHFKLSGAIERTWFDGGNVGNIAPEQEVIGRCTVIM